ncbi:hypothetical protein R6Z07M_010046 [Ovis aries]
MLDFRPPRQSAQREPENHWLPEAERLRPAGTWRGEAPECPPPAARKRPFDCGFANILEKLAEGVNSWSSKHPVVLVPNYGPLGSPPTCGQAFDVGQQYGLAQIMFAERQEPKKNNKIRRTQNDFGR